MKLKQKVIALLAAVCLLVPMLPVTGFAAGEIFSYSVIHNEEVLDTAELTVFLEGEDGSRKVLDSSSTGTIAFSRDNEELKGYKWLLVSIKLPEGYEFLSYGSSGNKISTIVTGMADELIISFYTEHILDETYDYGDEICIVTNPSVDGILELPAAHIEAEIGDVIEFDGAFDLNAARFPLYYIATDGTRTRVICDAIRSCGNSSFYQMEGHKLTVLDFGRDTLYFYYGNMRATLELNVPDPGLPSSVMEVNNREKIYTYSDGTEKRVVFSDNTSWIEGETDAIPTGCIFESRPVMDGEIYDRAREAVLKNFDTENMQVFEMKLWDGEKAVIQQPAGLVEVRIEMPENLGIAAGKTLMVYRMDGNGSLTRCPTVCMDRQVMFQTDHFSTFILAEVDPDAAEPERNEAVMPDAADVPAVQEPADSAPLPGGTAVSPKTADTTPGAVWILVIAAAVFAALRMFLKKNVV